MKASLARHFESNCLLSAQIIAHLSIIPMILYARPQQYLISLLIYFLTGCLGMTMTVHRQLSHGSWRPDYFLRTFGTLCATIGLTGSPIVWAAVHREHHRHTDKANDPHSPNQESGWLVQFFSMYAKPNLRYVRDLLKDPTQKFVHRNYWKINFSFLALIVLIDPFAAVYAYLFPAAILWNAGSAINSIGHLWGYRNHATADQSKNNFLLGLLVWGEGWHNNHHFKPGRSYYGERWWEIDLAGLLIKVLQGLHIARRR